MNVMGAGFIRLLKPKKDFRLDNIKYTQQYNLQNKSIIQVGNQE